jgi:hypothetical protein
VAFTIPNTKNNSYPDYQIKPRTNEWLFFINTSMGLRVIFHNSIYLINSKLIFILVFPLNNLPFKEDEISAKEGIPLHSLRHIYIM